MTGGTVEAPPVSARNERAAQKELARARLAEAKARLYDDWKRESRTDPILEAEFAYRFGPATSTEAYAFLAKISMPSR